MGLTARAGIGLGWNLIAVWRSGRSESDGEESNRGLAYLAAAAAPLLFTNLELYCQYTQVGSQTSSGVYVGIGAGL